MNFITTLVIVLSCTISVHAKKSEKKLNTLEVKKEFNIVEGGYKLTPGASENCISGDLEIFEGTQGILSLKMGGGLLAKHLDVSSYKDFEKGCSLVITTNKIKHGFLNEEIMTCQNSKLSYFRTFKAEFKKNKFSYEMRFKRAKKAGKVVTACYLTKKK